MITRKLQQLSIFILVFLLVEPAFAVSIPQFAQALTGPVLSIGDLVRLICQVTGIGFCLAAFVKYVEYRKGVSDVGLKNIVTLLLGGIALFAVTFTPMRKINFAQPEKEIGRVVE